MSVEITDRAIDAAGAVQYGYAPQNSMPRALLKEMLEAALPYLQQEGELLTTVRQCRICGCTDEEACPGGCSWSQPEICSTCAQRQAVADEQYQATLRAHLDLIKDTRALLAEQGEVAKMQREALAGATWRWAVAIAGIRTLGGALIGGQAEHVQKTIESEAQWFAHQLGNPPAVF